MDKSLAGSFGDGAAATLCTLLPLGCGDTRLCEGSLTAIHCMQRRSAILKCVGLLLCAGLLRQTQPRSPGEAAKCSRWSTAFSKDASVCSAPTHHPLVQKSPFQLYSPCAVFRSLPSATPSLQVYLPFKVLIPSAAPLLFTVMFLHLEGCSPLLYPFPSHLILLRTVLCIASALA